MEKYGVNENVRPDHKQADSQETCPHCGQVLRTHGSVRLCPTHGSRPFESESSKSE